MNETRCKVDLKREDVFSRDIFDTLSNKFSFLLYNVLSFRVVVSEPVDHPMFGWIG